MTRQPTSANETMAPSRVRRQRLRRGVAAVLAAVTMAAMLTAAQASPAAAYLPECARPSGVGADANSSVPNGDIVWKGSGDWCWDGWARVEKCQGWVQYYRDGYWFTTRAVYDPLTFPKITERHYARYYLQTGYTEQSWTTYTYNVRKCTWNWGGGLSGGLNLFKHSSNATTTWPNGNTETIVSTGDYKGSSSGWYPADGRYSQAHGSVDNRIYYWSGSQWKRL